MQIVFYSEVKFVFCLKSFKCLTSHHFKKKYIYFYVFVLHSDHFIFNSWSYKCAQIYTVREKQVSAILNMRGIRGYVSFRQASPFDVTELRVNLTNLQSRVGPYHVHKFPVPLVGTNSSSLCSNDNVGGHWNPFGLNTSDPTYPAGPGSTHDRYEVGDLNFSLPLFGQNSIVGRSVVIHLTDGARYVCASIGYPGEVTVGRAIFRSPVVGQIWFTQLVSNPLQTQHKVEVKEQWQSVLT
uniref:Superoxide dismutase copper/zinc binding domain-containing protein n=1 Tax=Acanthochromis polyacanthus TaxID=80966 RepID=A0A3Q1HEW0_9TELE